MGEKGNITSSELAGGAGAVVAGAGTQVTAVFQDAGEALKDKVLDKGLDAGIVGAQEKYRNRHDGKDEPENPSAT
jgi:hypothetical protein